MTLKASKTQPHKNFWQLENFVNHMSRMNFYIFIKSFGYVIWRIYYTIDYGLYSMYILSKYYKLKNLVADRCFCVILGLQLQMHLVVDREKANLFYHPTKNLFICLP